MIKVAIPLAGRLVSTEVHMFDPKENDYSRNPLGGSVSFHKEIGFINRVGSISRNPLGGSVSFHDWFNVIKDGYKWYSRNPLGGSVSFHIKGTEYSKVYAQLIGRNPLGGSVSFH
jgi:hypothetical protein